MEKKKKRELVSRELEESSPWKGGKKFGSSNRILNLLEETARTKVAEIKGRNKKKEEKRKIEEISEKKGGNRVEKVGGSGQVSEEVSEMNNLDEALEKLGRKEQRRN